VPIDALFITRLQTAITPRAIEQMVSKYLAEAQIANASVHTLRHTTATHLVAKGADLKSVQATLGHASLETTAMYVSLAKKAQRKVLQEFAL
jgi:site-specific recombinase XerD